MFHEQVASVILPQNQSFDLNCKKEKRREKRKGKSQFQLFCSFKNVDQTHVEFFRSTRKKSELSKSQVHFCFPC